MTVKTFPLINAYAEEVMTELDKFFIANSYDSETQILTCYCDNDDMPTIETILNLS